MRLITSPVTALAVILASVVLLAACGGGDDSEADAATATATATSTALPTSVKGELIPTATPFASRPTPTIVSDDDDGGGGGTGGSSDGGAPQSTAPQPTATSEPTTSTHVVAEGDTLSAIADQYGTTVEAIMEANDITDASLIFVGQELTIPAAATTGDTSDDADTAGQTHTVVEGDTLTALAEQYGTTVEAISEANDLTDSVIWIGQVLTIPDAAPAPDPTPTPTPEAPAERGSSAATYTVTDGDTATGIADAFGVTLQALADANDLTIEELNNLQIGQVLNIPAAGQ
ncbi:MAG: LysM peptidoglycan-binding domain-containing protein [Chloroflexi bacterium]|nr:LysM peptidoglycan-binding domain-containing protein [Chloroflexota bacterium]